MPSKPEAPSSANQRRRRTCDIVSHCRASPRTSKVTSIARVDASRKYRAVIDPRPVRSSGPTGSQPQDARAAVSLPWLTRLRWGTVAGQLVTVAVGQWTLGLAVPFVPVVALIGATAVTNLALVRWLRDGGTAGLGLCGAVLVLDTLVLTGLLHASGGPFNPFSVLYLVYIMLAAVVLGAAWTWSLAGLSVACYVALFLLPVPTGVHHAHGAATTKATSMPQRCSERAPAPWAWCTPVGTGSRKSAT